MFRVCKAKNNLYSSRFKCYGHFPQKLDNHLFRYSYIYITVKSFSLSFHESDSQTIFDCIADAGHTHVNYLTRDKNVGNSHNVLQSKSNHSFHVIEIILKTKLD